MQVQLKRAYDPPNAGDGKRILVDRLWPRGLARADAAIDGWLKELAPSNELRRWFGHDPAKWPEFKRRYFEELAKSHALEELLAMARAQSKVTLLFAAKDVEHNNAAALREALMTKLKH